MASELKLIGTRAFAVAHMLEATGDKVTAPVVRKAAESVSDLVEAIDILKRIIALYDTGAWSNINMNDARKLIAKVGA